MDDIDRAVDLDEQRMAAFYQARAERQPVIKPHYRFCKYCSDPTDNGEPYCCDECQIDDERLQRSKQLNRRLT